MLVYSRCCLFAPAAGGGRRAAGGGRRAAPTCTYNPLQSISASCGRYETTRRNERVISFGGSGDSHMTKFDGSDCTGPQCKGTMQWTCVLNSTSNSCLRNEEYAGRTAAIHSVNSTVVASIKVFPRGGSSRGHRPGG
jgi:hypothetical protein